MLQRVGANACSKKNTDFSMSRDLLIKNESKIVNHMTVKDDSHELAQSKWDTVRYLDLADHRMCSLL